MSTKKGEGPWPACHAVGATFVPTRCARSGLDLDTVGSIWEFPKNPWALDMDVNATVPYRRRPRQGPNLLKAPMWGSVASKRRSADRGRRTAGSSSFCFLGKVRTRPKWQQRVDSCSSERPRNPEFRREVSEGLYGVESPCLI